MRTIRLAFSPDGSLLGAGGQLVDQDNHQTTVGLWNTATGSRAAMITGFSGGVVSVAFSPDGKTIAAGDTDDGTTRLWSAPTGRPVATLARLPGPKRGVVEIFGLAFGSDGKHLVTANGDHTARLFAEGVMGSRCGRGSAS